MTNIKNIVLPIAFVGIMGGLIYFAFKSTDADNGQGLAPLVEPEDANADANANANASGGSRKKKG